MRFIQLHSKGSPELIAVDMVYKFIPAIKGRGSFVIDGGGESSPVDESLEEIKDLLVELDIEIIEGAND